MIPTDKATAIFFMIDEFFIEFDKILKENTLEYQKERKRNRTFTMSRSETMAIMILFYCGGFRNFKTFYIHYVQKHMQSE